jgi:hypothetical protein
VDPGNGTDGRLSRLSHGLWLDSLLAWQNSAVNDLLSVRQGELPVMKPCVQGMCMVPVSGIAGNLWQQHITSVTALPPDAVVTTEPLPLPELLLPALPRRRGVSRRMVFWRYAGLLGGIFLALAMLASWMNNQRLIRNVGDHLAFVSPADGKACCPETACAAAPQGRWRIAGRLATSRGATALSPGSVSGTATDPPVEAAVSDWAPPPPPPPVIKKIIQGPKTLRLDSMSLFDSGKWALKAGSTKMLVNSLVGIKAKPGWLIVVSGHTDNTGNPQLNQTLSLKRAERCATGCVTPATCRKAVLRCRAMAKAVLSQPTTPRKGVRSTAVSKSVWCRRRTPVSYRQTPGVIAG